MCQIEQLISDQRLKVKEAGFTTKVPLLLEQ